MATKSLPPTKVIIIGAGFSGVTMACNLQLHLGIDDYCIYDRSPQIGGAWYANTYPGCAVDIPGFCYTLSFAPKPMFSHLYPQQSDILAYINSVARHFGVRTHFTGSMEWRGCEWDESAQRWIVHIEDLASEQRYKQECRILVSCVGGLTNPREVTFPGLRNFQGTIMHTARWDHTTDFSGKRVVVIGSGASAAQLIPALAGTPASITQIVRTPEYLVPSRDYVLSRPAQLLLYWIPGMWLLIRTLIFLYMEVTFLYFQVSKIGEKGRRMYEKQSLDYIRKSMPDHYWPFLVPKYRFGCRRRIFDKAYTAALHRPDVQLVRGDVAEVRESSIIVRGGSKIEADIIVLATGFDLSHYDTHVQGIGGKTRKDHWNEQGHKSTFKSVAMHGFPNFFFVLGPNSGRLHTSTLMSIEWHSEYITKVIKPVTDGHSGVVQVQAESEKDYQKKLLHALDYTVHDGSCSSNLIDKKTGKNWVVYPWSSFYLWYETKWDTLEDWEYDRLKGHDSSRSQDDIIGGKMSALSEGQ
ncbi:flavin-binding monooxygenase [Fusarium globosum]|uniref:Flavin-binding monooxygenase n=1 Tax=Fusarium globosum TaxID=78864 RepID=A0A8H5XMF1_9HYPO|nr:flavin-binding monooxygenase [Fusarium globosum]